MLIIGQLELLASSHIYSGPVSGATYLWLLLLFFGRFQCVIPFELRTFLWSYLLSCMSLWGQIWNHCEFCNTIKLHICPVLWCYIPSIQAVMQESIFAVDGVGVWASTLVNNQLWRGCETHYWSRAEKSVTVVLYNYWWSQKMPRAKHNLLFVMLDCLSLVCVRPPCSAFVFPYHVYLYYVRLAFIFLLWFHLGKWILVLLRGYKRNKFFQTLQWAQVEYQCLDRGKMGLQERWSEEWRK